MKQITLLPVLNLLSSSSLFALGDYQCSNKSLCELEHHVDVDTLSEVFSQGKMEGQIRLASINYHNEVAVDTLGTALGGQLKYETAKLFHTSFAVSSFISQNVTPLSGEDEHLAEDFFTPEGGSFVYLGEAYVDYEHKHFNLRIGRQKLDTPLNDRDDIRMLPNTFEAAMAGYGGVNDFVFVAGYLKRWAGFDSGGNISTYKNILENGDGVFLAGVMNESLLDTEMQLWVYNLGGTSRISYMDAIYAKEYKSGLSIESGIQFGFYNELEDSGVDGGAYGLKLDLSYADLTLSAALNVVDTRDGKSIVLGHGGGPYFTSMEEMTIDAINDVNAYVFGVGYNFLPDLSLNYAYGHFLGNEMGVELDIDEQDLVLSFEQEDWDFELSYANINDRFRSGSESASFDRLLMRANYNFKTE